MAGLYDDFRDVFRQKNNGVMQLIIVNIAVFLLLVVSSVILKLTGHDALYAQLIAQFQLSAAVKDFGFRPWTLLTHFFAHEGIFHILFNMLFLYWFGSLVQEYLGSRRLINLYILGGLAGGLTFILLYNLLPYFHGRIGEPMLGASGATFAVVVGAATLLPNYTFFLLFLGPVRIKWIAAFYIVLSFSQMTGSNAGGNIAHLGGAFLGYVFIVLLQKGTDLGTPIDGIIDFFQRLFTPTPPPRKHPSMKVTYRSENTTRGLFGNGTAGDFPDDSEVDALLDKISKSGYESLNKEEKQRLFKASQKK